MSSKLALISIILGAGSSVVGCSAGMANVSDGKSAYVVRQTMLGTAMYHCTAEEEKKPVCKKVVEK